MGSKPGKDKQHGYHKIIGNVFNFNGKILYSFDYDQSKFQCGRY